MILVFGVIRMSVHSLTCEVAIRSKLHDLLSEDFPIWRMSSSDTGLEEDRTLLLMLALGIKTGADECSASLIFIILSMKKSVK